MLFVRDMTSAESRMLDTAKDNIIKLMNVIIESPTTKIFRVTFNYKANETDKIKLLVSKCEEIIEDINIPRVRVATKWHPISWIGFGFCAPFMTSRPILLSYKVFESQRLVNEVFLHELSHSVLNTKDIDPNEDPFHVNIENAWIWSNLIA